MIAEASQTMEFLGYGLAILLLVFALSAIKRMIWSRRIWNRMRERAQARAQGSARLIAALDTSPLSEMPSAGGDSGPPPFAKWVGLLPDGRVAVGEKVFGPQASIDCAARDQSNFVRALVVREASGVVHIRSHGTAWKALYQRGQWEIERT